MRDAAPEGGFLDAALRLAGAGLPVFPCLDAPEDPEQDKRPLTPHGFKGATADPAALSGWGRRWPNALAAVPTGAASGLYVIDADIDKETGEATGEATLEKIGLDLSAHPYRVRTRSGGLHFVFRQQEGLRNTKKDLPGVDTRGEGGYVIAWAPETLAEAARDPWLEEPPAAFLDALAAAKAAKRAAPEAEGGGSGWRFDPGRASGGDASAWAEAALADECAKLARMAKGGRNEAANAAAFALGQIVGAHLLTYQHAEAALLDAARACGALTEEPRKTRDTIARGLRDGMKEPRRPKEGGGFVGSDGFVGGAKGREEEPAGGAAAWPAPDATLLNPERGEPPAFPGEAVFSPEWARWIAAAAEAKGAPPDYVAAALLSASSALIGNTRWPSPWPGWTEPPVLWVMNVGAPSAAKSPALDAVLSPLREVQARLRRAAQEDRAAWAERDELAQLAEAAWREAVKAAVKKGAEPPEKPAAARREPEPFEPRLIANDVTIERAAFILSRQPRGYLAFRDELAGLLGNMSRYANGGSDQQFWLEAYGGRSYVVERMSREAVRVERLTIGLLGGIQPDKLASLLLRADDDGMCARFLPIWPNPAPIKRPERGSDEGFAVRAFERLRGLDMPTDEAGELRPWFVPFTPGAAEMMEQARRDAREAESENAGLMLSFAGKAPGFVIRIALTLAMLDWAGGTDLSPPGEVAEGHIARAAAYVFDYALPMARRAYAEAAAPAEEVSARRLAHLIAAERLETFTSRDVQQRKRAGLRSKQEIDRALDVLTQGGWIASEKVGPGAKGGRPQILYTVNPHVRELSR